MKGSKNLLVLVAALALLFLGCDNESATSAAVQLDPAPEGTNLVDSDGFDENNWAEEGQTGSISYNFDTKELAVGTLAPTTADWELGTSINFDVTAETTYILYYTVKSSADVTAVNVYINFDDGVDYPETYRVEEAITTTETVFQAEFTAANTETLTLNVDAGLETIVAETIFRNFTIVEKQAE